MTAVKVTLMASTMMETPFQSMATVSKPCPVLPETPEHYTPNSLPQAKPNSL